MRGTAEEAARELTTERDALRARVAELEAARPQWTTQAPTVEGPYMVRDRALPGHFQLVEVEPLLSSGRLVAYRCGLDGFVELSHFADCEWAGPLVAP